MKKWRYEPASDLDQPLIERLHHFPRDPDMFVYALRSGAAIAARMWLRLYHRFQVEGRENLPTSGSFVLVANHSSHLDTLCLLAALPLGRLHRAFPAAARDYFFVGMARGAAAAVLVNAFPFERQLHVRQSLELCRQLLVNPGNVLILFPEGTRSLTGEIGAFRAGIGWVMAGTDVPVCPCRLFGCFEAMSKGRWWPRFHRIRLVIGSPRTYPDSDPETATRDLQDAVLALGGSRASN